MRLRYKVQYYQEDGWWMARVPGIAGGQVTQGHSLEEARYMARDLVTTMLLAAHDMGKEPDPPSEGRLRAGWEWVYPDARVEVALLIRAERQAAGLTMQQAAERIGVTFSTYQKWEDPEKCNATVATLQKVARAFGRQLEVAFR